MLVEQRRKWREEFELGCRPDEPYLKAYEAARETEEWRSSLLLERLCEYILFLEEKLKWRDESIESRS